MKFKIFFASFTLLFVLSISVVFLDRWYASHNLQRQIDDQLETMATTIIASNLSGELLQNFENTDNLVRDVLDEQRIDRTIRIFSLNGRLLFSNEMGSAILRPLSIEKWSLDTFGNRKIKFLTLKSDQYIVEVGIYLDLYANEFNRISKYLIGYLTLIVCFLSIMSLLIAERLVQPLLELQQFLKSIGHEKSDLIQKNELLSDEVFKALTTTSQRKDEVGPLAKEILQIIENLRSTMNLLERNMYFLAHELKTPLARVVFDVEQILQLGPNARPKEIQKQILQNCNYLSKVIDDYIRLASLKSKGINRTQLYANSVSSVVKTGVGLVHFDSIEIKIENSIDFVVISETTHMESLVLNLISNAKKYAKSKVLLQIGLNSFKIMDDGPGLNEGVLKDLGQPFNRFKDHSGSGIGLAVVLAICSLYDWKFSYSRQDSWSVFAVDFGSTIAQSE